MKRILVFAVLVSAVSAAAEIVVVSDRLPFPDGSAAYRAVYAPDWPTLRSFSQENAVKPGLFPCVVDLETKFWLPLRPGDTVASVVAELSSTNEADSRAAAGLLALASAKQTAKSPSLKAAERKLVKFWRDEGAVAADAVSATADQLDAMYANWEATLNDAQLERKSAKYDRLVRGVERRGGTELGSFYHP